MNHLKYLNNFILNTRAFVDRKIVSKGYPPIIAIEPTNACMMKCIMCPRQYMKRKIGFMDFELFKKIIGQTKEYTNMISLELFGDSLLHPKIEQMVNYLHEKGIVSQISTNPMSLSDKAIDKIINSELDILLLSLDGIDDTTYKKYRGDFANYDFAIKQITRLLEKKLAMKKKKPFVDIRMIGMPGLKEQFKTFRKQWEKKGVDKASKRSFHTFGSSVKEVDGKTTLDSETHNLGICYKPWEGLHIMWDGKVVPCCFDYDGKCVVGDLNKQTLEEVWNGEEMQELRGQCLTKEFRNNLLCSACTERKKAKATRLFPFDTFLVKHLIDYTYQRNQNKRIVKILKKSWDKLKNSQNN